MRSSSNTPGYLAKQAFQARCKFSLAFENTYFPGYTTEKLSDPLLAGSVPIYSDEEAIAYIREVDNDDRLYDAYLAEPPFPDNVIPGRFSDATYLTFFQRIFG